MDAFGASMTGSNLADGGTGGKGDIIIQQEEKEIDKDGNIKIKQRTLKNPTKEELEKKTLDELEGDDGPDVTTIQTFKIKLNDNNLSDHAFSSFGLQNPVDAKSVGGKDTKSVVKNFIWFSVKIAAILGVG